MASLSVKMARAKKKPSVEYALYGAGSLCFFAAGGAIYYFKGVSLFLLLPTVFFLVFTVFFFTRYGSIYRGHLEAMGDEFVRLFTFFGIYINDGFNVYNALEMLRYYASEEFDGHLAKLLTDIEADKTVTPFVDFAAHFDSLQIKEVMVAIYQMVDEGNGGPYIHQFERLFGALSDQRHASFLAKKTGALETLGVLPLIGSGIAIMVLTVSIMEIMGGIANVL